MQMIGNEEAKVKLIKNVRQAELLRIESAAYSSIEKCSHAYLYNIMQACDWIELGRRRSKCVGAFSVP